MEADAFTQHHAGELSPEGVQHCVVCGMILTDYRNAATIEGAGPLRGWPPGPVFVSGNFYTTALRPEVVTLPCIP